MVAPPSEVTLPPRVAVVVVILVFVGSVTVGAVGAAVTVRVAALLVTEPALLVTTTV